MMKHAPVGALLRSTAPCEILGQANGHFGPEGRSQCRPTSSQPTVSPEDLDKLDIRVGTIERIEDIKRSEKLIRLLVISEITSEPSWLE